MVNVRSTIPLAHEGTACRGRRSSSLSPSEFRSSMLYELRLTCFSGLLFGLSNGNNN